MAQRDNLWAPWRIGYLRNLDARDKGAERGGCFLCEYWCRPEEDAANRVLWRTQRALVVFNRYPYTGGHLLIAPVDHVAGMEGLEDKTMLELMSLARDAQAVLTKVIKPHGFNLGINFNRCAGAGLPEHLHVHLVPRWDGDTNFMSVTGDVRVISQGLDELYRELVEAAREMGLPKVGG
jgi:ATP adenylyltransferase